MNSIPTNPALLPAEEFLLDSRLDDLKREVATFQAPDAIEDALVNRFRKHHRPAARPNLWWVPPLALAATVALVSLSLIHISEPTRQAENSYAVFCLKKKK